MSQTTDELLNAVLQLSEEDRIKIAGRLLQTLPERAPGLLADDPTFEDEVRKRMGDRDGAVSWEQLRDELRQSK